MSEAAPPDGSVDAALAQEVMDEIDAEFAELEAEIARISDLPQVAAPEKVALLDALRAKWRDRLKQRGDEDAKRPRWRRQIDKALEHAIEDILEDQAVDIDGNLAFSLENETVQRHAPKVMQALAAGLGEALTKGGVTMGQKGAPESGAQQLVRQLLAGFGTAVGKAMVPMAAAHAAPKKKAKKATGGEPSAEESPPESSPVRRDQDAPGSKVQSAVARSEERTSASTPVGAGSVGATQTDGNTGSSTPSRRLSEDSQAEPRGASPVALALNHLELTQTDTLEFQGFPPQTGRSRVFGGVMAGQAMWAASRTVEHPERFGHSFHGHFLAPGDPSLPIDYLVEPVRDGRSFSTRRVDARQDGKLLFSAMVGFHGSEPGLAHQSPMPAAPEPEILPTLEDRYAGYLEREPKNLVLRVLSREPQPFDRREVHPVDPLEPMPRVGLKKVWLRAVGSLPEDPHVHRAVLTYASDYGLLPNSLEVHGMTWLDRRITTASVDHTMWFHRPFRVDEWLLYVSESPSADAGRALSMGRIYRRDGMLVASVAQEGLIRITPTSR